MNLPVPAEGFDGGLAYEGWAVELGFREMVSSGETHSSHCWRCGSAQKPRKAHSAVLRISAPHVSIVYASYLVARDYFLTN